MTRVGLATALSALCGYLVLALAARDLGPAGYAPFGVFWAAFGLVAGAANGFLQQSTREVRLTVNAPDQSGAPTESDPPGVTRPLRVAAIVGPLAGAALAVTALGWGAHVFADQLPLSVGLLAVGLAGFCLHATVLGMLAGDSRWAQYGALMVLDAATRLLVAAVAFAAGWGLAGYLWATIAGSLSWLVLLIASPTARTSARLVARQRPVEFLRGAAHAVTAAAASAVLVMGFPVLLKATAGDLGAAGGVLILAITATRAPLLVPLTAAQGNLIGYFVDRNRLGALAVPMGVLAGVGVVGMVAAWAIGPPLLRWVFGPDYVATGALLAALTAGATALAALTITGMATVAAAAHRAYSTGWVCATAVAAGVLLTPLPLAARTVAALLCGPAVGIAVHLLALTKESR